MTRNLNRYRRRRPSILGYGSGTENTPRAYATVQKGAIIRVNSLGTVSRWLFAAEAAVLLVIGGSLGAITLYAVAGFSVKALLFVASCIVVLLGCAAAVDVLIRCVRAGRLFDLREVRSRVLLMIAAAVLAGAFTVYAKTHWSVNDRWINGFDFLTLGCFLWVPIVHIGILSQASDRA